MTHWKSYACALLGTCSGIIFPVWGNNAHPQTADVSIVQQQIKDLTGTVTDSHGAPMPGVSVSIKGTTQGTITNLDGKYKLRVEKGNQLVFSFIGMQSQTITYKGQSAIDIVLRDDNVALDDVVVIGYGSKNRKSLTSSVSSVKKEDIERMAPVSTNVQDLIGGGMLKGVLATQNSGEPGAPITINVRGITSPYPNMQTGTNNNAPLYVIDGVPLFVEATNVNPLMNLSPNDIESIDVLKDASATAIYGSRGANGVIIVTTKDGHKDEKPTVEIGYTFTVANPVKEFTPLNRDEFLHYTDELLRNTADAMNGGYCYSANFQYPSCPSFAKFSYDDNGQIVYEGLNMDMFGNAQTNWVKEVKNQNALAHQYTASIRGGSKMTNYSLSLNGTNQEGLYKRDHLETYGGRISLNTNLNEHFMLGGVMNYSETKRRNTSDGFGTASSETKPWLVRPDIPVYDENGNINTIDMSLSQMLPPGSFLEPSPVALLDRRNDNKSTQFLGNLFAEWEICTFLKFRTDFSMTNYSFQSDLFTPKTAFPQGDYTLDSNLYTTENEYSTMSLNFRFDYSQSFGNHLLGGMIGYGSERSKSYSKGLTFDGFPNDGTLSNMGSAQTLSNKTESKVINGLNSVYGRINYAYAGKYLLELSMRADASSKFGPGNQWGYFPALSTGWVISEEDFIKNKDVFNNLKLRLSIGQTGSTNVSDFVYKQYYIYGNQYGNQSSIVLNGTLPNRNIGWEKTSEINTGLDFSLFDNRLYGSLDWYYRYTSGALAPAPHIMESGMKEFSSNIIDTSNRGIEFSIGADIIRAKDFTWSTMLNISQNRNRIEKLNNAQIDTYMQDFFVVGKPMGVTKGFIVDHIIQKQEEIDLLNQKAQEIYGEGASYMANTGVGDYLLKDLNNDGIISSSGDRTVIANPEPDFFGGWQNTFQYKNWSLSVMMQFSKGGTAMYNNLVMDVGFSYAGKSTNRELYNNFWTPERTDARYARLSDGLMGYSAYALNQYVFSTSYLRMKNITLTYDIPRQLTEKLHIGCASIYAVATNLFTITDWPGIDPESIGSGTTMGTNYDLYPLSKSVSIGVKLQF